MSTKQRRRRVAKRRRAARRVEAERPRGSTNPHWVRQSQSTRDMATREAALEVALATLYKECK